MKNKILPLMLLLLTSQAHAASSFLESLKGNYLLSGAECALEGLDLAEKAKVISSDKNDGINIIMRIKSKQSHNNEYFDFPATFYYGSGKAQRTSLKGEPLPTPWTNIQKWETDEIEKTSITRYYQGVVFTALKSTSSLILMSPDTFEIQMDSINENFKCTLTRR